MSVRISEKIARQILSNKVVDFINKDVFIDMLFNTVDSTSLEQLIELSMLDTKYRPHHIGDFVQFPDPDTYASTDYVRLIDYGIATEGLRYGVITGSDDYKDKFNPFYYKMKVNMFDLDADNRIKVTSISVYSNILEACEADMSDLHSQYEHALRSS